MCHIRIVLGRSIILTCWIEMGLVEFVLKFVSLKLSRKGRAISICIKIIRIFHFLFDYKQSIKWMSRMVIRATLMYPIKIYSKWV